MAQIGQLAQQIGIGAIRAAGLRRSRGGHIIFLYSPA
jgi:hypothetical protein